MGKTKKLKTGPFKRPYATLYYSDAHAQTPAYSSQGHAASDRGAIRASVVRIFMGEYGKAVIYDREKGIPIYTVRLLPTGLKVDYGVPRESIAPLRRVK